MMEVRLDRGRVEEVQDCRLMGKLGCGGGEWWMSKQGRWLPSSGWSARGCPQCVKTPPRPRVPLRVLSSRHSKECQDDMPRGTMECPRCSWPGDLLKRRGGKAPLDSRLAGLGVGAELVLAAMGIGGVWRLRLKMVEKNPERGGGGGGRLRRRGGNGGMVGEGSVGRGGKG